MDTYERAGLRFDVVDQPPTNATEPPETVETVVLLHGFPQDATAWTQVSAALNAAGFRTLAPDQRGYSPGARPKSASAYRTREVVDDLWALLDAAGLEEVHLVGHDWGANVAWLAAADDPARITSLCALSVPHPAAFVAALRHGQAVKSWYMPVFMVPGLVERLGRPGSSAWNRFLHGLPPGQLARYTERMSPPGAFGAALNWYRAMPADLRSPSVRGGRITVPTMYVWGAEDPVLGRAAAEATARYVSGPYRFEVLDRAGHWLPEAHAEEVAALLLEHLASAS